MIPALLLALTPWATAKEPPFPDQGLEVPSPYDYETNTTWSPPPVEGLRELYTEAEGFVRSLVPAAPLQPVEALPPLISYPTPVGEAPDSRPDPPSTTRPIPGPGPMVPARANLVLVNHSSGWAEISVNDQRLGLLGPLARATLYGVRTGRYDVSYTLSTGYTWSERTATCPACTASDWPSRD